jgi:hypothetical protein
MLGPRAGVAAVVVVLAATGGGAAFAATHGSSHAQPQRAKPQHAMARPAPKHAVRSLPRDRRCHDDPATMSTAAVSPAL